MPQRMQSGSRLASQCLFWDIIKTIHFPHFSPPQPHQDLSCLGRSLRIELGRAERGGGKGCLREDNLRRCHRLTSVQTGGHCTKVHRSQMDRPASASRSMLRVTLIGHLPQPALNETIQYSKFSQTVSVLGQRN